MSKEDVKQYLQFLWQMNKPLYEHEKDNAREQMKKLEKKITLKQRADIKFLSDVDLCERYDLQPREVNPKYVNYVLNEDDKLVEEEIGSIIVSTEYKVMRSDMKTDFMKMRNNLIRQVGE